MRAIGLLSFLIAGAAVAQAPSFQPVGTMYQLMVHMIFPASDAVFYIERDAPKTEVQWNAFRMQALTLAESANLLMMPTRARDQGEWIKDSKMMLEAGAAAYQAALDKDIQGVLATTDKLTESCIACHQTYRKNYPKRQPEPQK